MFIAESKRAFGLKELGVCLAASTATLSRTERINAIILVFQFLEELHCNRLKSIMKPIPRSPEIKLFQTPPSNPWKGAAVFVSHHEPESCPAFPPHSLFISLHPQPNFLTCPSSPLPSNFYHETSQKPSLLLNSNNPHSQPQEKWQISHLHRQENTSG